MGTGYKEEVDGVKIAVLFILALVTIPQWWQSHSLHHFQSNIKC